MILICLVPLLLILTVASYYIFKKNFLSPSFLLCSVFLAGSLMAVLGNMIFWKENISIKVIAILLSFIVCFMIGEYLIDYLFGRKKNSNVAKAVTNNGSSRSVVFNKYNLIISILIGAIAYVGTMLYVLDAYKAAVAAGYHSGLQLLAFIRRVFRDGYSSPIYVSIINYISLGVGLSSIFLLPRQLFGGKKRYCAIYVVLIIPLLISQFISSARDGFVLDVVLLVSSIYYFGYKKYSKISLKEFFIFLIIGMMLFLLIFVISGLGTGKIGKTTNIFESFLTYGGSSIVLFDKALNSTSLFPKSYPLSYSFGGFLLLIKKFFPSIPEPHFYLDFVILNNGSKSNLYTGFMSYIADFGIVGGAVFTLVLGAFFSTLKNLSNYKDNIFIKFIYFFSLFSVVYSLFNPATNLFLSVSQIFQVGFSLISIFFLLYFEKIISLFKKNKLASNILVAFIAQGVSLVLSITMSFFVPKVLGVVEFSYWQLFLFYATYVGFFHLGYIDGLYLIYGGKKKEDIVKKDMTAQFIVFTVFEFAVTLIVCAIWCPFLLNDTSRIVVVVSTALYLIFSNAGLFFGYIFQALNMVKTYSISIIIEKLLFLITVFVFFAAKVSSSFYFIGAYVFYRLVFFAYLAFMAKGIVWGKPVFSKETFSNIWVATKRGFNLMIASLSSLLIMGISRFLIDGVWGIEAFGRFSFSMSLCSFALAFLSQVSMVFFPALRQKDEGYQKIAYIRMRKFLSVLLPLTYFAYFILKLIVNGWLPNYSESVIYFSILLPVCLFDGKMQMMCNTYFKVMNKEKQLLLINVISLAVTVVSSLIFAYAYPSIYGIMLSMIFGVAIRCIFADFYLGKIMDNKVLISIVLEICISVAFSLSTWFLEDWISLIIILVCYIPIVVYNRKTIIHSFKKLKIFLSKFGQTDNDVIENEGKINEQQKD